MGASNPVPTTKFEAWGQAVYRITPRGVRPDLYQTGWVILFAISDPGRQWLGWYVFSSGTIVDSILMGADHTVLAQKSPHPSHFQSAQAFTVEELAGPILASRGGRGNPLGTGLIFAFADMKENYVLIAIQGELRNIQIRLHLTPFGDQTIPKKIVSGWLSYVMSEPFAYPIRHLNVSRRLRIFEHNLTSSGQ